MNPSERTCVKCARVLLPTQSVCAHCHAPQPVGVARLRSGAEFDTSEGHWTIEEVLGEGAMGIVYRANFSAPSLDLRAPPICRMVALKQLNASQKMAGQDRFEAEAQAMRIIQHPNVVEFVSLFAHGGQLYLAMEYVEGETLEALIARLVARAADAKAKGLPTLPALPFMRAWHYFSQLLGALASAHRLGIVHRDIKPSNVLLRKDGIAKLSDFGIAHLDRGTTAMPSYGGFLPGTSAYVSPEQAQGLKVDLRSDLYSACIMLYEMLTGQIPFEIKDKSDLMIRMSHVTANPIPIRELLPQAPLVLETLFEKGLAKAPDARFGNAIELGQAFADCLGIPPSEEWRAQGEFATLVQPMRWTGESGASLMPPKHTEPLRALIQKKYRTSPIEAKVKGGG